MEFAWASEKIHLLDLECICSADLKTNNKMKQDGLSEDLLYI